VIGDDGGQHDHTERHNRELAASPGPTTPSGSRRSTEQPPTEARRRRGAPLAIGALVAVAAVLAITAWARSAPTAPTVSPAAVNTPASDADPVVAPQPVTATAWATLPQATTYGTVPNAAPDPAPNAMPSGELLHPATAVAAYAAPGGPAVAQVPPTELVNTTWLPIVAQQPGWAEVLLPSRPNDTAAWIYLDNKVTLADSPYRIVVDREHFSLSLFNNNREVGYWSVGVGAPSTPSPVTRTFIMSSIKDTQPSFSPIILATGAHSNVLATFDGGPATIGIHGWPTTDVFGKQISNGCIRIPSDALRVLSTVVPIGSPVLIS
jgi:hypothetical protein